MEKCVHESQLVFTGGFASLLAGSAVFHKGLQYFPRARKCCVRVYQLYRYE